MQEKVVRDLDLPRHGYVVDAKDPAFFSPFPDGRHLFMWQDRTRTLTEIAKFSKRDAAAYPKYEDHLERLAVVAENRSCSDHAAGFPALGRWRFDGLS